MKELYIIGNYHGVEAKYCGVRTNGFLNALTHYLKQHFIVYPIDIAHVKVRKGQMSLSKILGNPRCNTTPNILLVQVPFNIIKDIDCTLIYWHLDGTPIITGGKIDYAFRFFVAPGRHDYKLAENHKNFYPFVFMDMFDPNKKKQILISYIDRYCSFHNYRELLEGSCYTIIDANARIGNIPIENNMKGGFLSKRVWEALACKTIPIIVTSTPELYHKIGFREPFAIFVDNLAVTSSTAILNYDRAKATEGYNFVKKWHCGKKRMKLLVKIMNRVFT